MESVNTGTQTQILIAFLYMTFPNFSVTSMTMIKLQEHTPCKWKNLGSTIEPV